MVEVGSSNLPGPTNLKQIVPKHLNNIVGPALWNRFRQFGGLLEIRLEHLPDQCAHGSLIRGGHVQFAVDMQAQPVKIGRTDRCPAIKDRRLGVGKSRVDVHANSIRKHGVGREDNVPGNHAAIGFQRDDHSHVDPTAARMDELRQQRVIGEVGVLNVDVVPGVANGLTLQLIYLMLSRFGINQAQGIALGRLVFVQAAPVEKEVQVENTVCWLEPGMMPAESTYMMSSQSRLKK